MYPPGIWTKGTNTTQQRTENRGTAVYYESLKNIASFLIVWTTKGDEDEKNQKESGKDSVVGEDDFMYGYYPVQEVRCRFAYLRAGSNTKSYARKV